MVSFLFFDVYKKISWRWQSESQKEYSFTKNSEEANFLAERLPMNGFTDLILDCQACRC